MGASIRLELLGRWAAGVVVGGRRPSLNHRGLGLIEAVKAGRGRRLGALMDGVEDLVHHWWRGFPLPRPAAWSRRSHSSTCIRPLFRCRCTRQRGVAGPGGPEHGCRPAHSCPEAAVH